MFSCFSRRKSFLNGAVPFGTGFVLAQDAKQTSPDRTPAWTALIRIRGPLSMSKPNREELSLNTLSVVISLSSVPGHPKQMRTASESNDP
eukprot:1527402-Amphidinium_carterae.1